VLFGGVTYVFNFFAQFTVVLMLQQKHEKSKNINIPIEMFIVYFLTDAHE